MSGDRGRASPSPVRRLLLGTVATLAVLAGLSSVVSVKPAQALVPNDQVPINVSGALSSMTSNPAFQPAFSASTYNYAIYCQSGVNVISFSFAGVTPDAATVSLGENQAAVIQAANGSYWIRCLPHDFPRMQVTGSAGAYPGWYLTGNLTGATNGTSGTYAMILDNNGTPVWYQKVQGGAVNVEALTHDTVAWMPSYGQIFGANSSLGYSISSLDTQTTRTVTTPLLPTDPHELYPLPNGDYMMIGTPITSIPSPPGSYTLNGITYDEMADCVVQEIAPDGVLVWSWRASNHVSLAETVHPGTATVNAQSVLDPFHCNSVDVDPNTGNVLLSMRNTSAVYLIGRGNSLTPHAPIIWKLDGCGNPHVGSDNEPVLAVQKDPEGCFDGQHDARLQPNGDVSMYDDHTFRQGAARGVEYSLDPANATATWVWQYPAASSSGPNSFATGSFRRYSSGNDNLIGWGFRSGSGFTEVDANGNPFFSMTFPNGELEYRVVKVPLSTFDVNVLRATAGLPRPTFPTVSWGSLGGVLTSKPAVASWSANRLDAFVRGADGQLWHRWWDGVGWSNWEPLGGQLSPGTGPAVAAWGPGRLDVFVDGTDGQLWHRWYDSAGWHPWEPLGGLLASGPAASSWGSGRLDVVVEGTDGAVWHLWYEGGWGGWESLGGQTSTAPGIASWAPQRLDVFARGTDDQLWHTWYDSTGWHGWESLGGDLTSGPSAASLGNGLVDVAAAGTGGELERLPYNGEWQIWQPLQGVTSQPPSIVPFNGGELVFATGTDESLWFGPIIPTGA